MLNIAAWIVPNVEAIEGSRQRDARRSRGADDILIADLRRRDDVEDNGETEGGNFRPPRPVTRRDHTQLTQRYAALTKTMMTPSCLRLTHRRMPMINPSAALTLRSR